MTLPRAPGTGTGLPGGFWVSPAPAHHAFSEPGQTSLEGSPNNMPLLVPSLTHRYLPLKAALSGHHHLPLDTVAASQLTSPLCLFSTQHPGDWEMPLQSWHTAPPQPSVMGSHCPVNLAFGPASPGLPQPHLVSPPPAQFCSLDRTAASGSWPPQPCPGL